MSTDAELLRRYASEKSEGAFAELVARYFDLVYSSALRQLGGDVHRARDVSQVVFTTLARKADALTSHPVLAGWLYTATQHAAAKAIRTDVRRQAREQEAFLMQNSPADDHRGVDWDRVRPVLDEAMRQLPDRDREAVLLRFFARRPFAEIGTALQLSEDAARMRVERALGKLQALLARRGVTSTATALATALAQQAVLAAPVGMAAGVAGAASASASLGAAGSLAAWLSLMSTSKTATGIAALALIIACGGAFHEVRASREAQAASAATAASNETLAAKLQEVRTRAEALNAAATNPAPGNMVLARDVASAPTPSVQRVMGTPADSAAYLATHPELHQAFIAYHRATALERYEPFIRSLRLSAADTERFLDFASRNTATVFLDGNGRRLQYSSAVTAAEARDGLQALLGAEDYARYDDYTRRTFGPNGQTVSSLAGALYRTGTPLTAEQGVRLQDILAARAAVPPNGARRVDWAGVMQDAQAVLSAPQLAVLHQLSAEDRLKQAVDEAVAAARPAAPTGTATPRN